MRRFVPEAHGLGVGMDGVERGGVLRRQRTQGEPLGCEFGMVVHALLPRLRQSPEIATLRTHGLQLRVRSAAVA